MRKVIAEFQRKVQSPRYRVEESEDGIVWSEFAAYQERENAMVAAKRASKVTNTRVVDTRPEEP